jgi:branched-chain amino acid transport system permease protein
MQLLIFRHMQGQDLRQTLVTIGLSIVMADIALWIWGAEIYTFDPPSWIYGSTTLPLVNKFPTYRIFVFVASVVIGVGLWLLLARTRVGMMIRAGVDDRQMARAVGIPVSRLFTIVFCLGTGIAGAAGVLGGPILSAYPGLDGDMLPLALIVVILGGIGSLFGAFVGSFIIGFIYTFGTVLFPELAYIILFLPMIVVIAFRPQGLFGRVSA